MVVLLVACVRAPPVAPSSAPLAAPEAEARAFYLRAEVAAAHGERSETLRAAFWVPRLDERDAWAWVRAADLQLRAGDAEAAALSASRALALADVPEAHRVAGLAAEDPAEALAHLDRALGLPGVEAARIRAFATLGRSDDVAAALAAWAPADSLRRLDRAVVALEVGRPELALVDALALVDDPALGPDAARVGLEAGRRACDLARLLAAVREKEGTRWAPVLAEVARATGDAALEAEVARGDPDPAAYAAFLVDRSPEAALDWLGDTAAPAVRGRALAALGRLDEAVAAWSSLAPVDAAALEATALLAAGGAEAALARTDAFGSDEGVADVRVAAFAALGRAEEALALAGDDGEIRARDLLGDAAGAVAAAERVLLADRCAPEALVRVAAARGPCEAVGAWGLAAEVRPADPAVVAGHAAARASCREAP